MVVDTEPLIVTVSPTVPAGSRTVKFKASNSPGPTVRPLVQAHAGFEVSQVQPNCSFSAGSIVLPGGGVKWNVTRDAARLPALVATAWTYARAPMPPRYDTSVDSGRTTASSADRRSAWPAVPIGSKVEATRRADPEERDPCIH
ncbi:hypothetical protein Q0Z83_049040 [Actinoplanes sichuanensis]|nr:hypothetical protein Q0Z83_049040 [Actinoplanes sichuanensis]